jgi:hypothetical protein
MSCPCAASPSASFPGASFPRFDDDILIGLKYPKNITDIYLPSVGIREIRIEDVVASWMESGKCRLSHGGFRVQAPLLHVIMRVALIHQSRHVPQHSLDRNPPC